MKAKYLVCLILILFLGSEIYAENRKNYIKTFFAPEALKEYINIENGVKIFATLGIYGAEREYLRWRVLASQNDSHDIMYKHANMDLIVQQASGAPIAEATAAEIEQNSAARDNELKEFQPDTALTKRLKKGDSIIIRGSILLGAHEGTTYAAKAFASTSNRERVLNTGIAASIFFASYYASQGGQVDQKIGFFGAPGSLYASYKRFDLAYNDAKSGNYANALWQGAKGTALLVVSLTPFFITLENFKVF